MTDTAIPQFAAKLQQQRKEYTDKFTPLLVLAKDRIIDNAGALVFRHTIGWMGEQEHLEAVFLSDKHARDFASMMQSGEQRWTVVTVHAYEDGWVLGHAEVFHKGETVQRVRFGG